MASPSSANIEEFIDAKNTWPGAIISPDSTSLSNIHTFSRFYEAKIDFQTLDGNQYMCQLYNFNSSNYLTLYANYANYILEKNLGYPLFTFDARLNIYNGEIIDYQYIYYPHDNWYEDDMDNSEVFINQPYSDKSKVNEKIDGKYSVYHVFSLDENLSDALEKIGFDTQFDRNQALFDQDIANYVTSIQWKLRSRLSKTSFYAAAEYQSDLYCSCSNDFSDYYNEMVNSYDLDGMIDWVDIVFPGW